ncbi:hypothetical protein STXM2123_937 [Streptomyces sp. F-3]|nr:hypothetical protein STXM2123_937 [Streptomyces sp. F-3]
MDRAVQVGRRGGADAVDLAEPALGLDASPTGEETGFRLGEPDRCPGADVERRAANAGFSEPTTALGEGTGGRS